MLAERAVCSGCGLCEYVCNSNAITMIQDDEGFYYPHIDESKCVNCGKCNRLCPALNSSNISGTDKLEREKVYAGYQNNVAMLLQSSSGGAAYTIARTFILQGGVVFGVAYNEDYKGVSFIMAETLEELSGIRESKYVESKRNILYEKLVPALDSGRKVLVIGLPCDVAAAKALAGNNTNLYTCKLCCRSNTSNKALQQFVARLEKQNDAPITRLSLRYKEEGVQRFPTKCRADFANGKVFVSDFTKTDYGKAFQILARPSCFECKAKAIDGLADMTLGDFQGANPKKEYYNTNGLSLIVEHSAKGQELREMLNDFYLQEMPYDDVMSYNWMAYTSIPESPIRKKFAENFVRFGLEKACMTLIQEQNEAIDKIADNMIENQLRVAMWGSGDTAENLYERFRMEQWNLKYVFDSSKLKIGNDFKGMEILDLQEVITYADEIDVLAVMIPSESEEKLNGILEEIGWNKQVIHIGKYKFFKG